ncbi:MAG: hypothetical protein ACPHCI_01550 [Solirubrobacterales bacterium]
MPSSAKRVRKVYVAGRPLPQHANATRWQHIRALLGSRRYIWRFAIFGGIAFLAAAATGRAVLAAISLAIAVASVGTLLLREATRRAHRDYFAGFALHHGLTYSDRMSLAETTPLLSAGDRRHCEHYMEGPLGVADADNGGTIAGLAHYVYETREQRNDRRNRAVHVFTPHWFTVCVVDLPRAKAAFPGVFLSRRTGLLSGDGWLDRPGLQSVELERAMTDQKYELFARSGHDRDLLLELFQPSFQSWIVGQDFQVLFEYDQGTLVVYAPRRLRKGAELAVMLHATERIATQITRTGEPLHAVADSVAPPLGVDRFPPPPPATKPVIEAVPTPPIDSRAGSASVPPPGVQL